MKPALLLSALALLATPAIADAPAADQPQWNLTVNDDGATLTYAIPNSDDSGPGFSCPGGGDIDVYFPVDHREAVKQDDAGRWVDAAGKEGPWSTKLILTSGRVSETITADVEADEMDGGSMVVARITTASPTLQNFGKTGQITMQAYGETSKSPPVPRGLARRLMSVCSK